MKHLSSLRRALLGVARFWRPACATASAVGQAIPLLADYRQPMRPNPATEPDGMLPLVSLRPPPPFPLFPLPL